MIARTQIYRVAMELLQQTLQRYGRTPLFSELLDALARRLPNGLGRPTVQAVEVREDEPLPTSSLRENYYRLIWDLRVLREEYHQQVEESANRVRSLRSRLTALAQRSRRLQRKLEAIQPRSEGALWVYYDNLDDPTRIDWSATDAWVDLVSGVARCPYRAHAVLDLPLGSVQRNDRGWSWQLLEPIEANALYLESRVPLEVEVWAGLQNKEWSVVARGSVLQGNLLSFPIRRLDVLEVRVLNLLQADPALLREVRLIRLHHVHRAVYVSRRIEVDSSVWTKRDLQGVLELRVEARVPTGCSVEPRLILWWDETRRSDASHGRLHYLGLTEQSFLPRWDGVHTDAYGLVAVPFDGVPIGASLRLYAGRGQMLFRCVSPAPTLRTESGAMAPIPQDSVLDGQGWRVTSPQEVILYRHEGKYGLAGASTGSEPKPILQFAWEERVWWGALLGVSSSHDLAEPLSQFRMPGIPEGSDLVLRVWVHVPQGSVPKLRVRVFGSDGRRLPGAAAFWWNGERVYRVDSSATDGTHTEQNLRTETEWNLLEVAIRNGEALSGTAGAMLIAWYVDGIDQIGILPHPLEQVAPDRLMFEHESDVPRFWMPRYRSDSIDVLLPRWMASERVGPFLSDRLNLELVSQAMTALPRYVQAELVLRASGAETPLVDRWSIEVR